MGVLAPNNTAAASAWIMPELSGIFIALFLINPI
jgi:hypothetical protein